MIKEYPMTNQGRAERAYDFLDRYAEVLGDQFHHDPEGHIAGFLADVMHLCQSEDIDFGGRLRMAEIHFNAELDEDD